MTSDVNYIDIRNWPACFEKASFLHTGSYCIVFVTTFNKANIRSFEQIFWSLECSNLRMLTVMCELSIYTFPIQYTKINVRLRDISLN